MPCAHPPFVVVVPGHPRRPGPLPGSSSRIGTLTGCPGPVYRVLAPSGAFLSLCGAVGTRLDPTFSPVDLLRAENDS